jgi:hypothetical protein
MFGAGAESRLAREVRRPCTAKGRRRCRAHTLGSRRGRRWSPAAARAELSPRDVQGRQLLGEAGDVEGELHGGWACDDRELGPVVRGSCDGLDDHLQARRVQERGLSRSRIRRGAPAAIASRSRPLVAMSTSPTGHTRTPSHSCVTSTRNVTAASAAWAAS